MPARCWRGVSNRCANLGIPVKKPLPQPSRGRPLGLWACLPKPCRTLSTAFGWRTSCRTPLPGPQRISIEAISTISAAPWQQAIADFTEARRIAEQTGDLFRDVLPLCQAALRLAEATNDRFAKAMALRVVAEVQIGLSAANVQPADEAFVEAMQIHRHIGARPELARSCVSYAGLLRQTDEGEKARAWLRRAVDMFRQMDMTEELGRVEPMLRVS